MLVVDVLAPQCYTGGTCSDALSSLFGDHCQKIVLGRQIVKDAKISRRDRHTLMTHIYFLHAPP